MRRVASVFALGLFCVGVGCDAPAPAGEGDDPSVSHGTGKLVEIDLTRGAPEVRGGGLLRAEGGTFVDLLNEIETAQKASAVTGLFVKFGTVRLGWSRALALGDALAALRAQKKSVVCHADELGNATMLVAAKGCDSIWVTPAGGVDTLGIGAELVFVADLFTKFGIQADVLQVGKYKGTGEMFTRSSVSDEHKESLGGVIASLRQQWIDGVTKSRSAANLAEALEDGPHSAKDAKDKGLIDELGYVDAAKEAAKKAAHASRSDVWYGPNKRGGDGELMDLIRILSGAKRTGRGGSPHVALVKASGAIAMERAGGLMGDESGITARSLSKTLRDLAADRSTKAVILRIDSPGGSALASDLLWHELMEIRKKKPLIISVGDMAASGGYYMACAGTKIVAEPTSIVGSIGVVGGKMGLAPALEPFGIRVDHVGSGNGNRPWTESALTPWDDATKAKMLRSMTSIYDLFVSRVAEGRSMADERVRTFAEGRIFTGKEAKELGMIDSLGGLPEAISIAKSEAKLPADAKVRVVDSSSPGLWDLLGDDDTNDAGEALARYKKQQYFNGWVANSPQGAELYSLVAAYAPLLQGEHSTLATPVVLGLR